MVRTPGERSQTPLDELPVLDGAIGGILAYTFGLGVTYLLLVFDGNVTFGEYVPGVGPRGLVGWVFYRSHFAGIELSTGQLAVTRTLPVFDPTSTFTTAASAGPQLPVVVYHLVPMVLLVIAGFVLGSLIDSSEPISRQAQAGATVTAGYLPLAAMGTSIFTARLEGGATGSPEFLTAVLLAGVVFPVVFGAVGGTVFALSR